MSHTLVELYDYEALRHSPVATLLAPEISAPTLVLGSSQSADLLGASVLDGSAGWRVRRRRGGGGVVLLREADLWLDLWIPASDDRWRPDAALAARQVGHWWSEVLSAVSSGPFDVHAGPMLGESEWKVACFALLGEGEVSWRGRKLVGITQWRVREGTLLSTLLPRESGEQLASLLRAPPPGLAHVLEHASQSSAHLASPSLLVDAFAEISGPWVHGEPPLL